MVVADGMGGHVGGRVASTICARSFLESVRASSAGWEQRLEDGLNRANEALRQEAENQPDLNGMGSTLVGAVVSEAGLGWISIGDSALYHFHAGTLSRLNEDHSFGAYLDQQARDGLMTSEAAANDRRRNHLFYALLGDQLEHYERFSGFRDLQPGDLILLASDGLKTLSDEHIAEIVNRFSARPIEELVAELLLAVESENRDRQDNVSIIAARIAGTTVVRRASRRAPPDVPTAVAPPTRPTASQPPLLLSPKPPSPPVETRKYRLLIAGVIITVVAIVAALIVGFNQFR
jgi:serine/threonine protein phosphatase PrpC